MINTIQRQLQKRQPMQCKKVNPRKERLTHWIVLTKNVKLCPNTEKEMHTQADRVVGQCSKGFSWFAFVHCNQEKKTSHLWKGYPISGKEFGGGHIRFWHIAGSTSFWLIDGSVYLLTINQDTPNLKSQALILSTSGCSNFKSKGTKGGATTMPALVSIQKIQ